MRLLRTSAVLILCVAGSALRADTYQERLALRGGIDAIHPAVTAPATARSNALEPASQATLQLVQNGGFESNGGAGSSTFTGWTVFDQALGSGSWFVQSGTTPPPGGSGLGAVPAPPEGSYAAMTHQGGPGAHFLYQDIVLPSFSTANVTFQLYLNNVGTVWYNGAALDYTVSPNQQFRADLIDPASPIDTTSVLLNLYQTNPGDPAVSGYQTIQVAVPASLSGQTVRLRFTEVDNQLYLLSGVDDVRLTVSTDAVPTLSPWALALLALLMSGAAALILRRA